MKFVERKNRNGYTEYYLEQVTQQDFKFRNIAGTPTKINPAGGVHVVTIWVDNPDILQAFEAHGFYIGSDDYVEKDEHGEPTGNVIEGRKYINLKAYKPEMKRNRFDGKEEMDPKVVLKGSGETQYLTPDKLYLADGCAVLDARIKFRIWDRKAKNPSDKNVPVIQECWIYIDEKYGNYGGEGEDDYDAYLKSLGIGPGDEPEPLPFN